MSVSLYMTICLFVCLSACLCNSILLSLSITLFFFRPAGGTGDPHFVTLDGLEFTFNGFGEFVLLRAEELDFEIQVK